MNLPASHTTGQQAPRFPEFRVALPAWVEGVLPPPDHTYSSIEERMELAIELSRLNVKHGTGGPFGAAVFNMDTGTLLAPGVNIVVPASWSGGHGEMVAFAIAQQVAQTHDLGGPDLSPHEMVTSCEPCAMCFGAIPWSGVKRLVCAANEQDARDIGFDEGHKLANWVEALESRGIEVVQDVLRDRAVAVLRDYAAADGTIYNGRIAD